MSQQHKVKRKLILMYVEDSSMIELQNLAAHLKPLYPNIQFMITNKKMETISRAELKQMVKMLD